MRRALLLFSAGSLLAVAALQLRPSDDGETGAPPVAVDRGVARAPAPPAGAPRAIEFLELVTGAIDAAELAALERLAADADGPLLASVIAQVAVLPKLASRAAALEVLLARYAEIDAPGAFGLARDLELDAASIAPLFTAWAQRDARGALGALGNFDTATATSLGIAILPTLGDGELGIARVLGAAPHIDADRLRIEAAVAKAETDPEAAIDEALLLPQRDRSAAVTRVAAAWAKSDAHAALGYLARIGDERLRSDATVAVLHEWAGSDADAMLAYVRALAQGQQLDALPAALQALAMVEPKRVLDAAQSFPGELGAMLRRAALVGLMRDEPLLALGHAEALPPGAEREQLLGTVAHGYGRSDPAAAIAWAQASGSPTLLASVVSGVARVDPDRAIELAFTLPGAPELQRLITSLVTTGNLDASHTAALANRLLGQPHRTPALQVFAGMWARRAPADALPWLLANRGRATTSAISQAGMSLARTNPAAAVAYLDDIPIDLRAEWIGAVAEGYAQNDARAAATWLAQYRGEPGYDAAIATVAGRAAAQDPAAAASLFASVDATRAPDAAASARAIAARWTRQDPRAAAEWALTLRDAGAAAGATGSVAREWAAVDAAAARNWALGLPPDARRDAALVEIIGATAGTPADDPAAVEAFSSSATRQTGISEAVRIVAARSAADARQLADRHLTDPGLRQAAERFIGSRPER